ncbi:MAG: TRAP transporter substrate-binding protein DctP [Dehalococcoidia bacterium]|nr:TRAP transporter substrate-binding protein DctP [Dehalococcoidia bacterium]
MRVKYLALIILGALLGGILVTGCASDTTPTTQPTSPTTPTTPTTPSQPSGSVIKWDFQTVWPAGFQSHVACEGAIQRINKASGGRLEITLHPGGAIVPTYEILDGVAANALQGEVSGISAQFGKFPSAMFFDKYPAGPSAYECYVWLYQAGGMELWQELYDTNNINVHVVGVIGASQAENFGWFNSPVTSLNDFKGLKFRTQGTWGDVLTSLGASVVTMPGGEVYESAQRGVIDAFEYATPAVDLSAGFPEIRKVMMEPGIHAPTALYDVIVNADAWNALPDDLKAIVELGCQAGAMYVLAQTDYEDGIAYQQLLDMGIQVERLPDEVIEEIVVVANEFWDEMAKDDPFFAKVLKSQRDFLRDFRAMQNLKQPDPALLDWPQ